MVCNNYYTQLYIFLGSNESFNLCFKQNDIILFEEYINGRLENVYECKDMNICKGMLISEEEFEKNFVSHEKYSQRYGFKEFVELVKYIK